MSQTVTTFDRRGLRAVLLEALSEVLEMMAYTVVLEELPDWSVDAPAVITAEVPFFGTAGDEGRISLSASGAIALRIARTMSGLEDAAVLADPELLADAMRETANVVAGVVLRRLVTGGVHRLGLPAIVARHDPLRTRGESLSIAVVIEAPEGPIGAELDLSLDSGSPPGRETAA